MVSGTMPKSRLNEIITPFQEGYDGTKSDYNDEVPQFLVGSFGLLKEGHTLTAAKHVVLFDTEWMAIDEVQGIRRVSRVGQREKTATIKPVNMTSQIEEAIHDRQGAREGAIKFGGKP